MTIKITSPIDAILRYIVRIAYRRWNKRNRIPDGIPGIRDVRSQCEFYSPQERPTILTSGVWGCNGDGHYLCKECRWHREASRE